ERTVVDLLALVLGAHAGRRKEGPFRKRGGRRASEEALFDGRGRDLLDETRRTPRLDAPVDQPTVGQRHGQRVLGTRHPDVEEPSLLLQLFLILRGLAVR